MGAAAKKKEKQPENDAPLSNEEIFAGYWGKMLARYGGVTEAEYDKISEQRRKAKIGAKK